MVGSLIAFLTRLPLGSRSVRDAARRLYLFPLVGLLIGIIVYLAGYVSFSFLPTELASATTTLSIYLVTGLMHLDGLSDFFDGVMASGSRERKISAMRDPEVGIAGAFSALMVLILTLYSIKSLVEVEVGGIPFGHNIPMYPLGCALIVSEVSAKLGMNTCIALGKEMHEGIGSTFIKQSSPAKFLAALMLSIVIGLLLTGHRFIVVFTGMITALTVVRTAHQNFGGVNGDVMGASNEIARVTTLLVWIMVS
ncbi:MAG: adenosylcobinamide-GDP ribazoletransferase [Candidatus Geothermarchaeales archaeon]